MKIGSSHHECEGRMNSDNDGEDGMRQPLGECESQGLSFPGICLQNGIRLPIVWTMGCREWKAQARMFCCKSCRLMLLHKKR